MNNTQNLINAIQRANNEDMMVIKNGTPDSKDFIVVSGENGYNVSIHGRHITRCSCPHNTFRNVICKHMIKVSLTQNIDITGLGGLTSMVEVG